MNEFYVLVFYILGIVMGSFYSLVAYRLSNDRSIVKPRSFCDNCKTKLKWYELIPIASYIVQKGRCSYCNQKISVFYPVAELLCGILFALSFAIFGFSYNFVLAILLSSLLIITLITDLNYYIIPDEINIFFAIAIFILNIFRLGIINALIYVGYGLIIFIIMYLLMLLGNYLFKEESLGGGDIKLLFVLGMTVSLVSSLLSITIATFIALPIALYIFIKNKDKAIPFGPFLVTGFLLSFLFRLDKTIIERIFNIIMYH